MWSWILLLCLILLHYSTAIALSRHYYNVGECDALLHFRNSFTISKDASEGYCDLQAFNSYSKTYYSSNTSYPKTDSWRNGTDCCSWDGVTCEAATNSVIGLDLSCSWLQGPLHPYSSLFSLPSLRRLNLAGNDFNGSEIPSRFGLFREMEHLNLSNSGFSGLIPLGMLSNLSDLITLDISSLFSSWLTMEDRGLGWLLRNVTQLRELVLDRVDMSRVSPISLANISSALTSLSLFDCDMQGVFPIDIFHLPKLRDFSLDNNFELAGTLPQTNWTGPLVSLIVSNTKFHGSIPSSLGNLTSMNYLDLAYNGFTGEVPPTIGNLDQLTHLDLGGNNLGGSMEFEMFARLKHLEFLSLGGENVLLQSNGNCSFPRLQVLGLSRCNMTTGFPYFLGSSNELEHLDISNNFIVGPIPEWLGKIGMHTLTELDLSSNKITGEIPSSICQLSSLTYLDLSNNKLNGTIPRCLGNLNRLSTLYLGNNLLQGPLPQSLANCTSLEYLNVSYNGIYDTFPGWFHAANRLQNVGLQSNKFHGVIKLPIPPSLTSVRLSNNNFSGQLPTNFLLDSRAYVIDLSNNSFDGPLPVPPSAVAYYFVSKNKFTGEIPHEICNAMVLEVIDLSNNRLNGSIPHCFKNFAASLSVLDLRANKFVGHIPDIFTPESILRTARLSQNQLGGTLPRSLEYCRYLEVLDLSKNELEGSFPDWLGALPNLKVLILRSNKFRGSVGSSRRNGCPFANLRIIDISDNKFHGPLPAKYIAKLKAMRTEERNGLRYMNDGYYYQNSIVVVMKGVEIELVKILTLLTTIDLSSNCFEGEIPEVIGNLKALKGLNFSHNNLSGSIPSSMGNLNNLEWLDLSSNKLSEKIPRGLADITMLSWLNLSDNRLVGPIPIGTQFQTFCRAFDGNPGLCGHPLPNECGGARQTQPASSHEEEEETKSNNWIEWRAIPMGYGCGLVIGISAGYVMLETRRPRWLARMIERKVLKKRSRTRKNVTRENHARSSSNGR